MPARLFQPRLFPLARPRKLSTHTEVPMQSDNKTAAILVIGDEILSGRTREGNAQKKKKKRDSSSSFKLCIS